MLNLLWIFPLLIALSSCGTIDNGDLLKTIRGGRIAGLIFEPKYLRMS
jgi:hypothetical protein